MRCFLSAGHGPKSSTSRRNDPGALAGTMNEHTEAERICRQVAHRLRLVEPHVVPRGSLSEKIKFERRWSRAGDIAIEIHLNAAKNNSAHGAEAFHAPGSTTSGDLARALLTYLRDDAAREDRGAKPDTMSQHKRLAWCRRTRSWAVVLEVDFITNPGVRAWLSGGGDAAAAQAIAAAIDAWP